MVAQGPATGPARMHLPDPTEPLV